ncbi:amidase family protein [Streptomyces sp. NPDC059629]|uniref:amidase family protein n=1 Tax=Streptomyces sp. NPDC059629 TaxID=3346889 RepID=UPI003694891C
MNTESTGGVPPRANQTVADLGVTAVAAAIRRGEITSESYSAALLENAREHSDLNAFITIDESAVLGAARAADEARAQGSTAPLLGVPFGIKDSYATAGLRTTLGVKSLDAFVPQHDAEIVGLIKAAGGIVFGKNNLVEMSWGLTGDNSGYGQVSGCCRSDLEGRPSNGSLDRVIAAGRGHEGRHLTLLCRQGLGMSPPFTARL